MRCFYQVLEGIRKRGKSWYEIEKEILCKERRDWRLFLQ
jgi:hypothetical protein